MAENRRNPWSGRPALRRPGQPRIRPMPAWAGGRRRPRWTWRRYWRPVLNVTLLGLALLVAIWLQASDPPTRAGGPLNGLAQRVVDGDTLDIGGRRIRLHGLDAPERQQTCTAADGSAWRCGDAARVALRDAVNGMELTCAPRDVDRYGRVVAACATPSGDVGARLVLAGLAVAEGRYLAEETEARRAGRGVWQGDFQRPSDWRRAHQQAAGPPSRLQQFVDWVLGLFDS